jgi:endoglucanase
MPRILFFLLIIVPLMNCDLEGNHPESPSQTDFPSAKSLNDKLGQGINLGNALDQPIGDHWKESLKVEDFRAIADSGLPSVRLTVAWAAHASNDSPYTIDKDFMDKVVWAVDEALDKKLVIVVDMHNYLELYANPEKERHRFLGLWKQIANRFKKHDANLLFEFLNEPRDKLDAEAWNDLLAEAIETIRTSNPHRTLIVGLTPWGNLQGLTGLKLPASDSNLIVAVHYYEPHPFTHQGVAFEAGSDKWLGTTWLATQIQCLTIDNDMDQIKNWGLENKRPIFMGEFGTNIKVDTVSRELWTAYLIRKFVAYGFSSALWNFNSDFGIIDSSTGVWNGYLRDPVLRKGKSARLDSILATHKPIDVSVYVEMEDFEDDMPGLPTLARRWLVKQGFPDTRLSAAWSTSYSDTSAITNPAGDLVRQNFDTTENLAAFATLIGDWGYTGKGLHLKARLRGSPYPHVAIQAGILGGWDSTFVDLTSLTAVQFRAKGRGEWFIELLSDSVTGDKVENWGQMSVPFILTEEWQTYIFPVDYFLPKKYSKQEAAKLTWQDVRKKIYAMTFDNGQSYGLRPDDSLELWLDDIRLIGMKDADLGL